mmetsp:Transcript_18341/g.58490  ORF Transcript_18341/g.58490 Transcript_18341/m.58490 type:complete len:232 (-) Transcript_18341:340-1035(-)
MPELEHCHRQLTEARIVGRHRREQPHSVRAQLFARVVNQLDQLQDQVVVRRLLVLQQRALHRNVRWVPWRLWRQVCDPRTPHETLQTLQPIHLHPKQRHGQLTVRHRSVRLVQDLDQRVHHTRQLDAAEHSQQLLRHHVALLGRVKHVRCLQDAQQVLDVNFCCIELARGDRGCNGGQVLQRLASLDQLRQLCLCHLGSFHALVGAVHFVLVRQLLLQHLANPRKVILLSE